MKDFGDRVTSIVAVIALLIVLGLGIWVRVFGPCWMWNWAPAKDIPGRCIMK